MTSPVQGQAPRNILEGAQNALPSIDAKTTKVALKAILAIGIIVAAAAAGAGLIIFGPATAAIPLLLNLTCVAAMGAIPAAILVKKIAEDIIPAPAKKATQANTVTQTAKEKPSSLSNQRSISPSSTTVSPHSDEEDASPASNLSDKELLELSGPDLVRHLEESGCSEDEIRATIRRQQHLMRNSPQEKEAPSASAPQSGPLVAEEIPFAGTVFDGKTSEIRILEAADGDPKAQGWDVVEKDDLKKHELLVRVIDYGTQQNTAVVRGRREEVFVGQNVTYYRIPDSILSK